MPRRRRAMPEDRLPTHGELREAFEGVPIDPRTGYPAGYVSFSVELDARSEEPDGLRGGPLRASGPGGSGPGRSMRRVET